MSAETELYAVLAGSAGLAALVGSGAAARIYPDAIPEDKPLPAVVYSVESATPEACLDSSVAATATRFRLVGWGETRTAAKAVGDQIVIALRAIGVPEDNRFSGFDGEVGQYADVTEITWWG